MDRIKIALATGSIILLLIIIFLISFLNKKKPDNELFPINVFRKQEEETLKTSPSSKNKQFSPTLTPSPYNKKTFPTPKIFSETTVLKIQNIASKFPIVTESYQASFSAITGKILLLEKKPGGKEQLTNSLANLGISQNEIKNLVVSASSPEELKKYQEAEEIVINRKIEETIKIKPTPTPYKFKSVEEYQKEQELRATKSLENTIREIFSIFSTPSEYFTPEENVSSSPLPKSKRSVAPSLKAIISEVSERVGVPKGVLMGVILIENPAVFSLPEIKVREYSKPGAVWPECRPNVCSAAGPMQITTGIDSFGSSSCSKCCWNGKCLDTRGGCPNQWAIYSRAVNLYGGYKRNPNPCNILDNIYAGALKLKTDSKAKKPFNWTKEEVFRAAEAYYGNCTVKYKRLGNRTYCEYVWDYYQRSK